MKRISWIGLVGVAFLLFLGGCRLGNVQLTVLQTSDVHNHASGYGPFLDYTPLNTTDGDSVKGGYARMAALIGGIRQQQAAKHIPTLVFDSGDFLMGTVYDMTASNPIAMKYFTMAGYDAVALGNHEFDWSSGGLAQILGAAAGQGFKVPVIASNAVIPADDPLQALKAAGAIVDYKVVEYPLGLKVGILGFMGEDADVKAPAAAPVTFVHDYELLQEKVDFLRREKCVDLVMVLSHGGVENTGEGDDADLARNVKGIDVIASGHYHTATASAITPHGTKTVIFSPGEYGEYLSRLDITYNALLRKVVSCTFTLVPVNDAVQGDPATQAMVEGYHASLNAALSPLSLGTVLACTSFDLGLMPFQASSLGTLAADSVRQTATSLAPLNDDRACDFSVVASGVIRDPIKAGKTGAITFADIYNVLPLGVSPYAPPPQPLGYPLMSMYVKAADIYKICTAGMVVAPIIGGDFYLNFSGIRVDYNKDLSSVDGVYLCPPDDIPSVGPGTFVNPLDTTTLYHCVVDLYALQMMGALAQFGIVITPLDVAGNPIPPAAYGDHRLDAGAEPGIQELKEWQALMTYLTGGDFPSCIPLGVYGPGGTALGRVF